MGLVPRTEYAVPTFPVQRTKNRRTALVLFWNLVLWFLDFLGCGELEIVRARLGGVVVGRDF